MPSLEEIREATKGIFEDFEHTLHERIDARTLEVQSRNPNQQIIDITDIRQQTMDELTDQLLSTLDKLGVRVLAGGKIKRLVEPKGEPK